jgi:hypothetical protein
MSPGEARLADIAMDEGTSDLPLGKPDELPVMRINKVTIIFDVPPNNQVMARG